jgi:hypothetical protein
MTADERGELLQRVADQVTEIRENQAYLKGHVEQMSARMAEIPILVIEVASQRHALKVVAAGVIIGMFATAPAVFGHLLQLLGY